jgi:hypothetical protein
VDVHAGVDAPCSPDQLFVLVDDLALYPRWLDLVHRAEPVAAADGDERAWSVDLRARIGPLARSKRLRMVRSHHEATSRRVTFERRELDGKRHAPWVLHAAVDGNESASTLQMHLHYGGALWTGGVLERALTDQITAGRQRLLEMVQPTH